MAAPLVLLGLFSGLSALSGVVGSAQARRQQREYEEKAQGYLNRAQELSDEQLLKTQQALQAWEKAFGSIKDNLNSYYNSLNPASETARKVQSLEVNYQQANTRLNETLASRGLANSGIATQAQTQLLSNLATQKAEAEYNAPHDVAKQKLGYYASIAMPEKRSLDYQQMQAYQNKNNALLGGAQMYQGLANKSEQMANAGMQQVGSALGNLANTAFSYGMADQMGLLGSAEPVVGESNFNWQTGNLPNMPLTPQQQNLANDLSKPFLSQFINKG